MRSLPPFRNYETSKIILGTTNLLCSAYLLISLFSKVFCFMTKLKSKCTIKFLMNQTTKKHKKGILRINPLSSRHQHVQAVWGCTGKGGPHPAGVPTHTPAQGVLLPGMGPCYRPPHLRGRLDSKVRGGSSGGASRGLSARRPGGHRPRP